MELIGLDASLQVVKALSCTNIQWNRKYYEPGDYSIQLRAIDWDMSIAYVYAGSRPETGMVEKVEVEHTIKGDFVTVSGYFLENMLNWKVMYPGYKANANITAVCRARVGTLMVDTGVTVPAATNIGTTVKVNWLGEQLGDALYTILKEQELGQRIAYDYDTEALYYTNWQGVNRTQSQSTNAYAVFSQNFGTVDEMTITQDNSALKNYAVVLYDGGVRYIDLRVGSEPKRILYVDTGMTKEDDQTLDDFLEAVDTEARRQLAEYPNIINVDATVIQRNLSYMVDYDLGDKCDIQDDRLMVAFEAIIIEVNEVWKENTHTVSLQFGDKIPTIYQRGRA